MSGSATVVGTCSLGEGGYFASALSDIGNAGPNGGTNFDDGLDKAIDVFEAIGTDDTETNLVVFMSDGFPDLQKGDVFRAARKKLQAKAAAALSLRRSARHFEILETPVSVDQSLSRSGVAAQDQSKARREQGQDHDHGGCRPPDTRGRHKCRGQRWAN